MTLYPDGDKPERLFTAYRCPLCKKQINVYNSRGETLSDVWRVHQGTCRVRRETNGGRVCAHLGEMTDETIEIGGCAGGRVSLFACDVHGRTLPFTNVGRAKRAKVTVQLCAACDDYHGIDLCETALAKKKAADVITHRLQTDQSPALLPDGPPQNKSSNTPMGRRSAGA